MKRAARTPRYAIPATIVLVILLALALGAGLLVQREAPSAQVTTQTVTTTATSEIPAAEPASSPTSVASSTEPVAAADVALQLLSELEVKGRAPMTDYEREAFGQAWSDDVTVAGGRNGCDTRNDVLRRDLEGEVIREGTHGCLVETGTLDEPYSGETISFARGDGQVEIDHVVALGNAWATGAQYWDEDTRRNFANDPANLLAVETSLNRQKSAGDAATWLPPNKDFRCEYVSIQIGVKYTYGLWVTPPEEEAMRRELGRC